MAAQSPNRFSFFQAPSVTLLPAGSSTVVTQQTTFTTAATAAVRYCSSDHIQGCLRSRLRSAQDLMTDAEQAAAAAASPTAVPAAAACIGQELALIKLGLAHPLPSSQV